MEYLIISFVAGILTVLAPCVLPMLPVILGGSVGSKSIVRPVIIIASSVTSIVIFTLLLRVFTLNLNEQYLKLASIVIIGGFGLLLIFPHLWEKIAIKLHLGSAAQAYLQSSSKKEGIIGYILLGVSLGPIFSACSPTYFLIVGTILPQSFVIGLVDLLAYAAGMFLILLGIVILGRKLTSRLYWLADSDGLVKKILGLFFIFLAIAIYFAYDKAFEAWLLDLKLLGVSPWQVLISLEDMLQKWLN